MKTELLSPAGTLKSMNYAFAYGADAVYIGQPRYSLRVRNNEFSRIEKVEEAIQSAHKLGKKVYIACNIAAHNQKIRSFERDLEPIINMRPDALIMSDPGMIFLVRERWPEQSVHLSVQANAINYATVRFWQRQGIERVILSRELSLDEIEEIRLQCPEMELEVFVHGSLCIAYSGRCLLSGYMAHRDSNQGMCTNACRWQYNAHGATETETGDLVGFESSKNCERSLALSNGSEEEKSECEKQWDSQKVILLQEKNRPNELMPAYEDEHGTYILNSKDLRAIQHVERLVKMGIHSLKIEGRTKSHYYVARTAALYRQAIDAAHQGIAFDWNWARELEHLANRGYTEGFYRRHVPSEHQNYLKGNSANANQQFVGEILEYNPETGEAVIDVKNRFELGDTIHLIHPKGNRAFQLDSIKDKQGQELSVAPGSGHQVRIQLDVGLGDETQYALLMRNQIRDGGVESLAN